MQGTADLLVEQMIKSPLLSDFSFFNKKECIWEQTLIALNSSQMYRLHLHRRHLTRYPKNYVGTHLRYQKNLPYFQMTNTRKYM